ncbi:MAG TPA: ParA family protein [Acidobacteriaceae bacterium]
MASYKGGVGKTTTAVHLAAYLQSLGPALLLDGDQTRNATAWSERGEGFPFRVAPIDQAAKLARNYQHIVIDTGQRPSGDDLKAAADGCDLLVVPTIPGALETDGLGQTVRALQSIGANFRVLLTSVPPDAAREVAELHCILTAAHAPVFSHEIPRLKAFKKAAGAGCIVCDAKDREATRAWESCVAVGRQLQPALTSRETAVRA